VDKVSLPNLLADEHLVPELIQHDATPEKLGAAVLNYLENPQASAAVNARFDAIHRDLRRNASSEAADAILQLAAS
jgi:lipid-A-disaccharide synthase